MRRLLVRVQEPGAIALAGHRKGQGALRQLRDAFPEIRKRRGRVRPCAPHVLLDPAIGKLPVGVAPACDAELAPGKVEGNRLDDGCSGIDAYDYVPVHAGSCPYSIARPGPVPPGKGAGQPVLLRSRRHTRILAVGRASFVIRRGKKVRESPRLGARRGPQSRSRARSHAGRAVPAILSATRPGAGQRAAGTAEPRRLKSALREDAGQTGGSTRFRDS